MADLFSTEKKAVVPPHPQDTNIEGMPMEEPTATPPPTPTVVDSGQVATPPPSTGNGGQTVASAGEMPVSKGNSPTFAQNVNAKDILGYDPTKVVNPENVSVAGNEVNVTAPNSDGVVVGDNFMDFAKKSNLSVNDAWRLYGKMRANSGQDPADVMEYYNAITQYDANQSIAASEKAERKRKRQENWEKIGNLLSHIGNFAGTLAGAPSQTLETGQQLTERQKKVRDSILAQRKEAGNTYFNLMLKQKAEDRQRDLAEAQKAYQQAKGEKEKAVAAANVKVAEARAKSAEAQAKKYEKDANLVGEKAKTEEELRPEKVKTEKSKQNANNARAGASKASADYSTARTNKVGREQQVEDDFDILSQDPDMRRRFAQNNRMNVEDAGTFADTSRGKTWEDKNIREAYVKWVKGQIKNGYKLKTSDSGKSLGIGVSSGSGKSLGLGIGK